MTAISSKQELLNKATVILETCRSANQENLRFFASASNFDLIHALVESAGSTLEDIGTNLFELKKIRRDHLLMKARHYLNKIQNNELGEGEEVNDLITSIRKILWEGKISYKTLGITPKQLFALGRNHYNSQSFFID